MIKYPTEWRSVGSKVKEIDIVNRLIDIFNKINVKNISYSGGVDSSILLWIMCNTYGAENVTAFTIALDNNHPDYKYSEIGIDKIGAKHETILTNSPMLGNETVNKFYAWISGMGINAIVAGDGVDEFNCGYYDHTNSDNLERTYFDYIYRLQEEQLIPLDTNSGSVNVFLPYIDVEMLNMFLGIPLYDKIKNNERKSFLNRVAKYIGVPECIIQRWKYGFCDASREKEIR